MSKTSIPQTVKYFLWGNAAGRCQYRGCNIPLYEDPLKKSLHNIAYHAHIIGDSSDGPRGDIVLSEEYAQDLTNLMLLCDSCHRRVDKTEIDKHPVSLLREMKKEHEDRIETTSSIQRDRASHIVSYFSRIGEHSFNLSFQEAGLALLNEEFYPADKNQIELSWKNSSFGDSEKTFWEIELPHLRRQFASNIRPRIASGDINHISVFALAPQPLLIELGRLLGDINFAETYQLLRDPKTWCWQSEPENFSYKIIPPESTQKIVAINFSLSANVTNDRIIDILGNDVSIWTMTIENPNNNYLISKKQLKNFSQSFREVLNKIKMIHGRDTELHIFPAVPASIAVEIGRVWMPKADLPFHIYEQNTKRDGFFMAHTIINEDH